jgi:hypothetical protein
VDKVTIIRKVEASISRGQDVPSCDICGRKGHTETTYRIRAKAMNSTKKETKDRSSQWEKDNSKKLNHLLQQIQLLDKKKVQVKNKMKMTRTKRIS